MNPLRACLPALAALTLAAAPAAAQTSTDSGLYSLGQGLPGSSWGLRSDAQLGLKWKLAELGLDTLGNSDLNRSRLYADWFPFGSGFRVVSGLNVNDPLAAVSTTTSSRSRYGNSSPYLGIGYSQSGKGLGFYADMGVALGTMFRGADPDADNGAQLQQDGWRTISNGWLGLRYQPSMSLGLVYRY